MYLKKRFKVIACEILLRELYLAAAKCTNLVDIVFMEKGLHDIGAERMSQKLQLEIDRTDPNKYDAILLCYGLCNNGICNLNAVLPLVIPRAHDCITLLLGSKERYHDYFDCNPGTFFKSSGWVERDNGLNQASDSITSQLGMGKTLAEYVELYGEENAEYLLEMLGNWESNYKKIAYIDTQTGNTAWDKAIAKEEAISKNWEYEEVKGDIRLLCKLLEGEWDEQEFLVVAPNNKIAASNNDSIIESRK